MNDMVQIRSIDEYFDKYAVHGIGKGADPQMIRKQLIDAFHKEIFGLVSMRAKKEFDEIPAEGDPEALRIAQNVIKDETKKWMGLIRRFEMYKETSGLLKPDDLALDIGDMPESRAKNTDINGNHCSEEQTE